MFDVVKRVYEAKAQKRRLAPCHTNRASEAGHPCSRYLYYSRVCWTQRAMPSPELQFIFDMGRLIETEAIRELQEAGFVVWEQGRAFHDEALHLTGHIDMKISERDVPVEMASPCEVKGMNHLDWTKINSLDDMLRSHHAWVRRYPAQLVLYLYLSNSPEGLFYLKDKQAPHLPKQIWVNLDEQINSGYVDEIITKLQAVNKAVAAKEIPPPIPWDDDLCGRCDFLTICLPDQPVGPGLDLVDDPTLLDLLTRRADLIAARQEYEAVDKQLKKRLEGRDNVVCGSWLIRGRMVTREGYAVQGGSFWKLSISKLDSQP